MSKVNPDYEPKDSMYCKEHSRFKIQDFGGNNICIECLILEILIDYEYEKMINQIDNKEVLNL